MNTNKHGALQKPFPNIIKSTVKAAFLYVRKRKRKRSAQRKFEQLQSKPHDGQPGRPANPSLRQFFLLVYAGKKPR